MTETNIFNKSSKSIVSFYEPSIGIILKSIWYQKIKKRLPETDSLRSKFLFNLVEDISQTNLSSPT